MDMHIDLRLEKQCWSCGGNGKQQEYIDGKFVRELESSCEYCKGIGYILTTFGEEVLEMVKRHLNAKAVEIPEKEE